MSKVKQLPKIPVVTEEDERHLKYHSDALKAYINLESEMKKVIKSKGITALEKARLEVELADEIRLKIGLHSRMKKKYETKQNG